MVLVTAAGVVVVGGAIVAAAYYTAPARSYPKAEEIVDTLKTENRDDHARLTTKVALITGANAGIGFETAKALVSAGCAHVILVGRSRVKLQKSKEWILTAMPNQKSKISILVCDLGNLDSVKGCAKAFYELFQEDEEAGAPRTPMLHILINNAGIMALPEREATQQGLEQQVGVCHVGHFYLTQLLLPALQAARGTATDPARIVCLSSVAHKRHNLTQLLSSSNLETTPYKEWTAYGNAKACNLLHAAELHKRYYRGESSSGTDDAESSAALGQVAAFSVMPGGIWTNLQTHVGWQKRLTWQMAAPFFFKTPSQGAATTLVCATMAPPDTTGGQYHDNCKVDPKALELVLQQAGDNAPEQCWNVTTKLLETLGYSTTD